MGTLHQQRFDRRQWDPPVGNRLRFRYIRDRCFQCFLLIGRLPLERHILGTQREGLRASQEAQATSITDFEVDLHGE